MCERTLRTFDAELARRRKTLDEVHELSTAHRLRQRLNGKHVVEVDWELTAEVGQRDKPRNAPLLPPSLDRLVASGFVEQLRVEPPLRARDDDSA